MIPGEIAVIFEVVCAECLVSSQCQAVNKTAAADYFRRIQGWRQVPKQGWLCYACKPFDPKEDE
jgi:hypothetical protein